MWRYTNVAMALLHATATATALHLNCVCACVCVLWLDNAQPQWRGRCAMQERAFDYALVRNNKKVEQQHA